MAKISVLGAGTWGLGIAILLHNNGHEVTVWSALPDEINMLQTKREHKNLPGVLLPQTMIFTQDMKEASENADLVVMAVASVFTRQTARRFSPYVKDKQVIVNVAKGIEEDTMAMLTQLIEEKIPL